MDERVQETFLTFVGNALFDTRCDAASVAAWDRADWEALFRLAARQGVLAVVYDAVSLLPKENRPPRNLNLQWALSVENIENRYCMQLANGAELAGLWTAAGFRPVVLKGFAVSRYYPVPEHRECGDFDCFLGQDRELGDSIAVGAGAVLEESGYKHSHILYKGLMVENHRFCIGVRGSREAKELERFLEGLLEEGATEDKVPGTDMILPPVMFNALFLTFHGLKHFLGEGIRLRHICDWACFVAREQQNMDWQTFYAVCDRYHMRRYADVMTAIAVHGLGLRVENPEITVDSRYADRVLSSVLNDNDLINSRGRGKWWERFKLLSNMSRYRWKYREIYQKGYFGEMVQLVTGFVLDRNPKI